MVRGEGNPTGFDALAMVMVDYEYDDAVFDVVDVFYADELAKKGFRFSLPEKAVGKQLMLIYVDVYGNEHREVKTREALALPSSR